VIRLAERGENIGVLDYVAVSYCWESYTAVHASHALNHEFLISTLEGERKGERRPRCPDTVLYRAIMFAQGRNIPFIWIDQECINQDDPSDKERYLQVMHEIYSRSSFTIGILSFPVITVHQIMYLLYLENPLTLTGDDSTFGSEHRLPRDWDSSTILEMRRLLQAISRDRWFSRTWILQEKIAGMQQLVLLLPNKYGHSIRLPGWTQSEIEITPMKALETAVGLRSRLDQRDLHIETSLTMLLNQLHSMFAYKVLQETHRGPSHITYGLELSESSAFRALESCDNAIVADRLTIFANIFNFQKRLDTRLFGTCGITSFTTAFIALLVNNGRFPLVVVSHPADLGPDAPPGGPIWPISATLGEIMNGLILYDETDDTEERHLADAQLVRYGAITSPYFTSESRFIRYHGSYTWQIDFIKSHFRESDAPRWNPGRLGLQ
jgi:hypothetical protein